MPVEHSKRIIPKVEGKTGQEGKPQEEELGTEEPGTALGRGLAVQN
jgi:hypothetical protein